MLAAGGVWKTVNGRRLFNNETFDDLEDETRKTSGDYSLIEQFA